MNDNKTTISEIKEKLKKYAEDRNYELNPKNVSMSIAIEAAELMEIYQWVSNDESKELHKTDKSEHIKEELADVIIYALHFANKLGIDVSDAIEDKMIKNAKKYPL